MCHLKNVIFYALKAKDAYFKLHKMCKAHHLDEVHDDLILVYIKCYLF